MIVGVNSGDRNRCCCCFLLVVVSSDVSFLLLCCSEDEDHADAEDEPLMAKIQPGTWSVAYALAAEMFTPTGALLGSDVCDIFFGTIFKSNHDPNCK